MEAVRPDHRGHERLQVREVRITPAAGLDAPHDFDRALGAATAGGAARAALVFAEREEELAHVEHARVLVEEDDAAATEEQSQLPVRVERERQVAVRRADARKRSAGLEALEHAPFAHSAAPLVDDCPDAWPERHFDTAGPVHRSGEGEHLRALLLGIGDRTPPLRAVAHDHRGVGVGLDVVHVRGLVPEARLGRERRLDAGHAPVAVNRTHEACLVAADIRPGAEEDHDLEVLAAAEDVLAEEALLAGLLDGLLHAREGDRVLVADVDVPLVGVRRQRSDEQAFDDEVRVAFEEHAVHPRARVAFVGVAHQVARRSRRRPQEVPLAAGREARAGAAAEAAVQHLLHDRFGVHFERLAEPGVAIVGEVVFDALRVSRADVRHQPPHLALHERVIRKERDVGRRVALNHADRELGEVAPCGNSLDELVGAVRRHVPVEDGVGAGRGAHGHARLHPAEPPRPGDAEVRGQLLAVDGILELRDRLIGAARQR